MKVINTIDKEISVKIKGVSYTLPALGELHNVPQEHAEYWKGSLHNFIKIMKDDKVKSENEVSEVEDLDAIIDDIIDDAENDIVDEVLEKPVKKAAKKKKAKKSNK